MEILKTKVDPDRYSGKVTEFIDTIGQTAPAFFVDIPDAELHILFLEEKKEVVIGYSLVRGLHYDIRVSLKKIMEAGNIQKFSTHTLKRFSKDYEVKYGN